MPRRCWLRDRLMAACFTQKRYRSGFIEIAGAPSLPRCCALAICRRSSPRLRRHATRPSVSIPAPHPGMERSPRFFAPDLEPRIHTDEHGFQAKIKWISCKEPISIPSFVLTWIFPSFFLSVFIRVNPWFQIGFALRPGLDIMGCTSETS